MTTSLVITKQKTKPTNRTKPLLFAIQLACASAITMSSGVIANEANTTSQKYTINASPLAQCLNRFSTQSGVHLSADAKLTQGKRCSGVSGKLTVTQALTQLLKNTGLQAIKQRDGSYLLSLTSAANVLATAQVTDDGLSSNTEDTGSYTTGSMSSATGLNISMRDTPQSVSIVTSQLIQDQDLRTLADVVNTTAGLSLKERDSARLNFSARGFAINNYQLDGITMAMSNAGDAEQSTAIYERVEVVRGATGLLTGAGDPSAAINLVRKRANSKTLNAKVKVNAGSWSRYHISADVSTPLNSDGSVRARFVAEYEQADSYVDLAGTDRTVLYGVVDADLTESTHLSAGMSYQDNKPKSTTWGGLPTWYNDGSRTDWDSSKTNAANWTYWHTNFTNYFANISHTFDNNWQLNINLNQVNYELDRQLLYVSGTVNKNTGAGLDYYPSKADASSKQNDINVQLIGDYQWLGRSHELLFGFSNSTYNHTSYGNDSDGIGAGGDFTQWDGSITEPTWSNREKANKNKRKQNGFYAATRVSMTESFKAIVGGRLSNWDDTGIAWGDSFDYGDVGVFTPYIGLLYDFTKNHSLYGSYTEIFVPQDEKDSNNNFLDPLVGSNYELGLKSEFFAGALTTSIAIFSIEQDNFAILDTVKSTLEKPVYNSGYASSKGFEAEVIGELSPGWNLSLSYSQYTAEDAEGKVMLTEQPRKLAKLYTSYNFYDSLENLTIAGGINWQDSNYTDIEDGNPITGKPETLEQEAYALVSLMARYDITEQLSTQLNIDNLLDKKYYSQIGFYDQHAFGKPRSVNLNVSYQF